MLVSFWGIGQKLEDLAELPLLLFRITTLFLVSVPWHDVPLLLRCYRFLSVWSFGEDLKPWSCEASLAFSLVLFSVFGFSVPLHLSDPCLHPQNCWAFDWLHWLLSQLGMNLPPEKFPSSHSWRGDLSVLIFISTSVLYLNIYTNYMR